MPVVDQLCSQPPKVAKNRVDKAGLVDFDTEHRKGQESEAAFCALGYGLLWHLIFFSTNTAELNSNRTSASSQDAWQVISIRKNLIAISQDGLILSWIKVKYIEFFLQVTTVSDF